MANTPLFRVDGTDIDLHEVAEWNRRTIADGRWLNDNNIKPLIDNDIILAKSIQKYGNYDVDVVAGDGITIDRQVQPETRTKIFTVSLTEERRQAYINANRGKDDPQLAITLSDDVETGVPLGYADKVVGFESLSFSSDKKKITGLVYGKKYILSAELVATVNTPSNQEHTVTIKTTTGDGQFDTFEFHIDCTQAHSVSKSITWMAEEPSEQGTLFDIAMSIKADSDSGVPGVTFSVANIFCLEQGGIGSDDGSGPVFWIGRDGIQTTVSESTETSLSLPANPDFGGRSIRAVSETEIGMTSGVYQIDALIDVKLNETIDTITDVEVDFGEGFTKCRGLAQKIGTSEFYTLCFSFLKHATADESEMCIKIKCPSNCTAYINALGIAKISGGSGSGSDPSESQWIRTESTGTELALPTSQHSVDETVRIQSLAKTAGTMEISDGYVILPDNRLYRWNLILKAKYVSGNILQLDTEADIYAYVESESNNDPFSHVFHGTIDLDRGRSICIPLSGVTRGPGRLSLTCRAVLKSEDSNLNPESVVFAFDVASFEVTQ
jgi:hypothetical protein